MTRILDNNEAHKTQDTIVVQQVTQIQVMRSQHYILHATVGRSARIMLPVWMVLEMGSVNNVMRCNSMSPNWETNIVQDASLLIFGDVNGNPLYLRHAVRLRVCFGNALYPICFFIGPTSHAPFWL